MLKLPKPGELAPVFAARSGPLMPTILYINDGVSTERMDHFEVKSGESLKEVLDRMGVSYHTEHVPTAAQPPRKLSPGTEEFIRDYKPEDSGSVLAIYWHHHSLEAEEFDTVEEAERFLKCAEEYGSLAGEAIVASKKIRVWD